MLLFLTLSAAIWIIGRRRKTPTQARWLAIGLLYVVFIGVLVVLPAGTPLAQVMGGSIRPWLAVGIIGAAIYAYSLGLKALRSKVRPENRPPAPETSPDGPLSDGELDRYARHIVLREVGGPGQRALKRARVLVIGAGGLGAPVLQYLAGAGVGTIGVIDDDVVDASNLQRQVIHSEDTLGMPKVFSAEAAIKGINPYVTVQPYNRRLDAGIAAGLFAEFDLVLDGSDNFDTRYLTNQTCVDLGVPLIAAAITQWEGQISLYDPASGGPCYQCVFPKRPAAGLAPSCAEAGVIGPLPGVLGAMMAVEAVKMITGAGQSLRGEMLLYDGLYSENRKITLKRDPDCPICSKTPAS